MSFLPDEALKGKEGIHLAPMIDFLFLMLMFFACLAVSRATSKDTHIELAELKPETSVTLAMSDNDQKIINISIDSLGHYQWITEIRDYPLENAEQIAQELCHQYTNGLLPEDKEKTQILLRIDKNATWDPILKAIFAIRDAGFNVRPVYEPDTTMTMQLAGTTQGF